MPTMRQAFAERLKQALKARDARTVSTVRLMLAALNERDVAARGRANVEGVSEAEIQQMLQTMIKRRREAITLYDQGNRPDLAQRERDEIAVIDGFLPRQFEEAEIEQAAAAIIAGTGASGIKNRGEVMAALRHRHGGVMDFARAGAIVRRRLG